MKNQLNKQFYAIFSSILTIAFLTFGFVAAKAHEGDGGGGECETKACRAALTDAKKATAKYHDFQTALNEGFVQLSPCVSAPGLGAMGFHYGNFGRLMNPNTDVAEPEILLYIPDENGEMRLVGLEYVVPAPLVPTPPTLFGQTYFYSPERNSYELHVWAWRNNPSGTFAPFNPKLKCPSPTN